MIFSAFERSVAPLAVAILLALPAVAAGCGENGGDPPDASAQTPPEEEAQTVDLAGMGFDAGDDNTAALAVIEFSDYGCVFCASFHEETYPALHEEFIEGGDVLWKYIPISIAGFPNGDLAATAGQCGGDLGAFEAMRDVLYEQREEWLESDRGDDLFVEYAESAGIEGDAFRACLEDGEARAQIEANSQIARQIGVEGTPTFIVQGMPVRGAPELEVFQEALRELVSEARGQTTP